jgi:hypothetical protein
MIFAAPSLTQAAPFLYNAAPLFRLETGTVRVMLAVVKLPHFLLINRRVEQ